MPRSVTVFVGPQNTYAPPEPTVWVTDRATLATAITNNVAGTVIGLENGVYNCSTHTTSGAALAGKAGNSYVARNVRQAVFDGFGTGLYAFYSEGNPNQKWYGVKFQNLIPPNSGGLGAVKLGTPTAVGGGAVFDNCEADNIQRRWIFMGGSGTDGGAGPTHIRRCYVHHCGDLGSGYQGNGSEVTDNEFAFINQSGAFGDAVTKWVGNHNLYIARNYSHHHNGHGLWVDANNMNVTFEDNMIEDCVQSGIHYEVSFDGIVRRNTIRRCGFTVDVNQRCGGIKIVASKGINGIIDVYGNTLEGNAHGVECWDQIRIDNAAWRLDNVHVHDNLIDVTRGTNQGFTGLRTWDETAVPPAAITPYSWDASAGGAVDRVLFTNNTHIMRTGSAAAGNHWWENTTRSQAVWQAAGEDTAASGSTFSYPGV